MGKSKRSGRGFAGQRRQATAKPKIRNASAEILAQQQRAESLIDQGSLAEAEGIYRELIAAGIKSQLVYGNLAAVCGMQGKLSEVVDLLRQALVFDPDSPDLHFNLGNALMEHGDLNAALAAYRTALGFQPDFADAQQNLANVLTELGDLSAARAAYKTALALQPDFPDAQQSLGMAELLMGEYKSGWTRYENRFLTARNRVIPHACPPLRQWDGSPLGQDCCLLLVSEQGLGDTLQFMRYAIALRDRGCRISLCAQSSLHSLIQASGIDPSPLDPEQAHQVTEGLWIPLLSVPRYLDLDPDHPIINEPYIQTSQQLADQWASVLSREKRPIIGIHWQGNPEQEKMNSLGRSLPLETFSALAALPSISLLSLQKGFGSEQLEACSFRHRFVHCQDRVNETWDFLETAAIIANCDLVITSDTAVAHLAGGMGKPTWLLLKKVPDWRWGMEGEATFWYPSMRLFRQRERGNWQEVLERVASELQSLFPGSQAPPAAPQDASTAGAVPSGGAVSTEDPQSDPGIMAPLSLGELIDAITILQTRIRHGSDQGKSPATALGNSQRQLDALEATLARLPLAVDPVLIQRLGEVNQNLWRLKDAIREQERQKSFGETFIYLVRSVLQLDVRRAAIQHEINAIYGSALLEESEQPSSHQHGPAPG